VSVSSRLAAIFVRKWKERNPAGRIIHHNTSLERLPYLDPAAFVPAASELTVAERRLLALSDQLTDELIAADLVVLAAPMWNLGIPASLKAWIDLVVREGHTFAFTSQGVRGLLPAGKTAYVFSACGGAYSMGTAMHSLDLAEPYLRAILGAIGLTGIRFIRAENQSCGPEAAAAALARAEAELEELLA
jgi:FMN-dependent NADH-azoreductase